MRDGPHAPAGPQQFSHPAAPLPAYTSLSRQQLHQRLKAAISHQPPKPGGASQAGTARQWQQQPRVVSGAQGSPAGTQVQLAHPPQSPPAARPGSGASEGPASPSWGAEVSLGLSMLQRTASGHPELDQAAGFEMLPPTVPTTRRQRHKAGTVSPPGASSPPPAQNAGVCGARGALWPSEGLVRHETNHPAPTLPCQPSGKQQQGVHRGLLLLQMPPLTEQFEGKEVCTDVRSCCLLHMAVFCACG
jgi:hypothetical protein